MRLLGRGSFPVFLCWTGGMWVQNGRDALVASVHSVRLLPCVPWSISSQGIRTTDGTDARFARHGCTRIDSIPICADPCRAKPASVSSVANPSQPFHHRTHRSRLRRHTEDTENRTPYSYYIVFPTLHIPNTFRVFCDGRRTFCVFRGKAPPPCLVIRNESNILQSMQRKRC